MDRLITEVMGLNDSFVDDPFPTCNVSQNCFTKPNLSSCRIDYIFYSPQKFQSNCSLEFKTGSAALSGNIPGRDFPYSDHEGLQVIYNVIPPKSVYTKQLLTGTCIIYCGMLSLSLSLSVYRQSLEYTNCT